MELFNWFVLSTETQNQTMFSENLNTDNMDLFT